MSNAKRQEVNNSHCCGHPIINRYLLKVVSVSFDENCQVKVAPPPPSLAHSQCSSEAEYVRFFPIIDADENAERSILGSRSRP